MEGRLLSKTLSISARVDLHRKLTRKQLNRLSRRQDFNFRSAGQDSRQVARCCAKVLTITCH